jgi:4-diphosphocytidyl-2-C-methyl-D-erythritol kinase
MWAVLLMPDTKRSIGKTGKMYSMLDQSLFSTGEKTDNLVKKLATGEDIGNDELFNVFEEVAYNIYRGLDKCRDDFLTAGAPGVHLAGSGPTLFTLVKDKRTAFGIYDILKEKGYLAFAVKTLGNNSVLTADWTA